MSTYTGVQTKKTSLRPSDVAQQLLRLQGKRYSLQNYPMFVDIFNTPAFRRLMRSGRQVSKTITIGADMLTEVATTPHLPIIYANASQSQTNSFSKSKLAPLMRHSPAIYDNLLRSNKDIKTDNIGHKQFTNSSEIILTYFSESADRIRGSSGSRFYLDEAQDILYDAVIDAEECLSAAENPRYTYAGTSKTVITTLEYLWTLSSQKEWIIKCDSCNLWNIPSTENIQKQGLSCKKCGALLDTYKGHWHSFSEKPAKDCFIDGFHIPQIVLPLHCCHKDKWEKVIEKLETYPSHKFNNEVMGLPSGEGDSIITEELLQSICIPNLEMENRRTAKNSNQAMHMVAGIDWGGYGASGTSRTALAIYAVYPQVPEFRMVFGKVFVQGDPTKHVEEIAHYITQFGCTLTIGDHGGGHYAMSQLAPLVRQCRVVPAMYNDNPKPYKWNDQDNRYDVNRTSMIDGLLLGMQKKNVRAIRWEDFRQFKEDFLAVREEVVNESSGRPRRAWRRYPTKPDDFLHAMVFGWLACRSICGMVDFTSLATAHSPSPFD